MAQVSVKITVVVATAIALSLAGIGYAFDYSAVTHSSSGEYDVKYVLVVVNENGSGALTETFDFGTPAYYTDTVVKTHTVSYRTPDYHGVDTATIRIAGSNTDSVDMYVSLEEALPSLSEGDPSYATITLQFYVYDSDLGDYVEYGNPVVLTETPQAVSVPFELGTTYRCEAALDIESFSGDSEPAEFTAKIIFTASADTEEEAEP